MEKVKVFCNGENLIINGEYVCDCCDGLEYQTERILDAIGIDYEYVEEEEIYKDAV